MHFGSANPATIRRAQASPLPAESAAPHAGVLILGRDSARRELFRYAFEGAGHLVHEAEDACTGMASNVEQGIAAVVLLIGTEADVPELFHRVVPQLEVWHLPLLVIVERQVEFALPQQASAYEIVRADCSPRDIVIRLRRLLRDTQIVEVGPVRLDAHNREVHCAGRRCALSPREFDVLHLLMLNAGEVLSRKQIQRLIWGDNPCTARAVDVWVRRIRTALGEEGGALLETLRLVGYRFAKPAKQ